MLPSNVNVFSIKKKNCYEFLAEGVFVARGKEDALVTRNLVPGSEVYGEKRISVEVSDDILLFFLFLNIRINMMSCAGVQKR